MAARSTRTMSTPNRSTTPRPRPAAAVSAGAVVVSLGPQWWRYAAGAAVLPLLARFGRPADKPITDRVMSGNRYRKLTAELVRRALTSLQMPAINGAVAKDPNAI